MWFLLNFIPPAGQRRSILPSLIEAFNQSEGISPSEVPSKRQPSTSEALHKRQRSISEALCQAPGRSISVSALQAKRSISVSALSAKRSISEALYQAPGRSISEALSKPEGLDYFAPTFVSLQSEGNKVVKTEKPLLYHYIFIKGDEETVKRFCHTFQGFSFVLDRAEGERRHITYSDQALQNFRILASYHSGKLPCYPLDGINLEEGDKVQIVSGPCAGLTGTYISRKGAKSGNILIAIDGSMAAVIYDVNAEYVRVLEFARDTKRVYDQLDAFASRLLPSINDDGALTPSLKLTAAATVFTRRLGTVKLHNPKLDAKLQVLLYGAYRVLSDAPSARETLQRYRALESHVTNPKTAALCSKILTL